MVGQALGALAQPVFSNSPARVSGDWFAVHERDIATTVGSLSNLVGTALGAVIAGVVVSGPSDIQWWLLGQAVASLLFLTATFAWVRDRPLSPPSASVEHRDVERGCSPTCKTAAASAEGGLVEVLTTPQPATPTAPEDSALFHKRVGDPTTETPIPPSPASRVGVGKKSEDPAVVRRARAAAAVRTLWRDACTLLRHVNFLLLVCAYGIGVGLFSSIITLSGQISELAVMFSVVSSVGMRFHPLPLLALSPPQLPPVGMGRTLLGTLGAFFSSLALEARRSCAR